MTTPPRSIACLRIVTAALLTLVLVGPCARGVAQDVPREPANPTRDLSVYQISAAVDAPILGVATVASILPDLLASRLIEKDCPCDANAVNRLDRRAIGHRNRAASVVSDITLYTSLTLPVLADLFKLGPRRAWLEDAVVFLETLAINGALVNAAKYGVQRPRPRTYAGDATFVDGTGGYRSFYSGHTSNVFAALSVSAMTLRLRYGERYWPWLVTGVLGVSVAVERVAAGQHFPTDVMVGAVMGTAVGVLVPYLHRRAHRRLDGVALAPSQHGALLTWSRRL